MKRKKTQQLSRASRNHAGGGAAKTAKDDSEITARCAATRQSFQADAGYFAKCRRKRGFRAQGLVGLRFDNAKIEAFVRHVQDL